MTIAFYSSGYCVANGKIANPTKPRGKVQFHAVWAYLDHPVLGKMLVDTGYTPRFYEVTRHFPEKLYALSTPVFVDETQSASAILKANDIDPDDIRYILLTYFHADHIGGLRDFPNARFLCSKMALEEVKRLKGFWAVKKGIIGGLFPDDFMERVEAIDMSEAREHPSGLKMMPLLGQNDLELVHLPGHAQGMTGLLIHQESRSILFAADAQWSIEAFENGILPSQLVRLFFDSWTDFKDTAQKLRNFHHLHPEVPILFTHCPETLKWVKNND